jgi:hypothetical protein
MEAAPDSGSASRVLRTDTSALFPESCARVLSPRALAHVVTAEMRLAA